MSKERHDRIIRYKKLRLISDAIEGEKQREVSCLKEVIKLIEISNILESNYNSWVLRPLN